MKHEQLTKHPCHPFAQHKPAIVAKKPDVVLLVMATVALATSVTFAIVMATLAI